jgi:hypothetical protein
MSSWSICSPRDSQPAWTRTCCHRPPRVVGDFSCCEDSWCPTTFCFQVGPLALSTWCGGTTVNFSCWHIMASVPSSAQYRIRESVLLRMTVMSNRDDIYVYGCFVPYTGAWWKITTHFPHPGSGSLHGREVSDSWATLRCSCASLRVAILWASLHALSQAGAFQHHVLDSGCNVGTQAQYHSESKEPCSQM